MVMEHWNRSGLVALSCSNQVKRDRGLYSFFKAAVPWERRTSEGLIPSLGIFLTSLSFSGLVCCLFFCEMGVYLFLKLTCTVGNHLMNVYSSITVIQCKIPIGRLPAVRILPFSQWESQSIQLITLGLVWEPCLERGQAFRNHTGVSTTFIQIMSSVIR